MVFPGKTFAFLERIQEGSSRYGHANYIVTNDRFNTNNEQWDFTVMQTDK